MRNNYNIKTVPNQKVIRISKVNCNKANLYATINIEAMSKASLDLDGNVFKLWVYFASNQDDYTFALSSKDVLQRFGLKIDAYNRAIKILIEKGYLVETSSNHFTFYEIACDVNDNNLTDNSVNGKTNNEEDENNPLMGKTTNTVMGKTNNALSGKPITPYGENQQEIIHNNTYNNIYNNTVENEKNNYNNLQNKNEYIFEDDLINGNTYEDYDEDDGMPF